MYFPVYRCSERIIQLGESLGDFLFTISLTNARGRRSLTRRVARGPEYIAFRQLRMSRLAPSIVAIAFK